MSVPKLKFLFFLLFHSHAVYLDDGSGIGRIIQSVFLLLVILMLLMNRVKSNILQNKTFLILIVGVLSSLYFSTKFNLSTDFGTYTAVSMRYAYFHIINILTIFYVVLSCRYRHEKLLFFKVYFYLSFVYCILSDICTVLNIGFAEGFLVGNKFTLSFLHLSSLVYYYTYKELETKDEFEFNYVKYLIIISVIVLFSGCTTGLFGAICLCACFKYKQKMQKLLFNPFWMAVCLICFTSLSFLFEAIANTNFFSFVIVDILHKDLTMTGRLEIYEVLWEVIQEQPIWGFGSHHVMMNYFGMANAQNGLFDLAVERGMFGVISFLLMFIYTIKKVEYSQYTLGLLALVFMYIALSCVEITFGLSFNILLVILYMFAEDNCINEK